MPWPTVPLPRHRNSSHITLRQDWFTADDTEYGPHINHAYMFERKGYSGDALNQLESWAAYRPHFHKLTAMRPKWGLDFSIDYCDREGNVFELLHWEYDGFDYNEVADKKEIMDEFLRTRTGMNGQRPCWNARMSGINWAFFEQSEWKTEFFGIDKERFKMVLWK